jgi:hypothetical protein
MSEDAKNRFVGDDGDAEAIINYLKQSQKKPDEKPKEEKKPDSSIKEKRLKYRPKK